jgi:hypothetical protein
MVWKPTNQFEARIKKAHAILRSLYNSIPKTGRIKRENMREALDWTIQDVLFTLHPARYLSPKEYEAAIIEAVKKLHKKAKAVTRRRSPKRT